MSKVKFFEGEVFYLVPEVVPAFVDAASAEEAVEKMTAEAKKQNLIGFEVRKITEKVVEVPDQKEDTMTLAKTLN